jgi:hypothetical protein
MGAKLNPDGPPQRERGAGYPYTLGPAPRSSFGGTTIPFDIIRAWNDGRRGGRTETAARGCTGFTSRTYRARFGLVATAEPGCVVAGSFEPVPGVTDRAARFAAFAAWYFAFAKDSFDGSFAADCFFEDRTTDGLRGGWKRLVLSVPEHGGKMVRFEWCDRGTRRPGFLQFGPRTPSGCGRATAGPGI